MSVYQIQPSPGYILLAGPNNNESPVYAQPSITNLPGFPSSFAGQAFSPLVVNSTATGVAFLPSSTNAIRMSTQNGITVPATTTSQLTWTTQEAGSLAYNASTGDVLISQSGWYILTATIYEDSSSTNFLSISITNGAGAITTVLATKSTNTAETINNVSIVAPLTIGQTVGVFYQNTKSTSVTIASSALGNFSVKNIL